MDDRLNNRSCPSCGRTTANASDCAYCLLSLGIEAEEEADLPDVNHRGVDYAEKPGDFIGRYRLLDVLGEGGFGTVWRAEQLEPVRRQCALKVIKPGMDTREVVLRFEGERQALALMDHPNIARVYDGGATAQGRPYFVMELVEGEPITNYCDRRKLSLVDRVHLFSDVCSAVQHAHQKGIIHRDLKPSNLLVMEVDGKPLPKVVDFGIAKAIAAPLTDKLLFTRQNQLFGTPQYMSPEQAGRSGLDVDTRSDVYSLGVMLYELIVGQLPLPVGRNDDGSTWALDKGVINGDVIRPSARLEQLKEECAVSVADRRGETPASLVTRVRGELDWLTLKALDPDRGRRYQTPNALALDLQSWLRGDPITAVPPTWRYQFTKLARRHRGVLLSASALILTLVMGVITTAWQALRATRLAESEARLRAESEQSRKSQRISLYASEMSGAYRAWESGEAVQARELLARQPADLRGWEWRHLSQEAQPAELAVFPNFQGYVSSLAYSRDGAWIATGSGGNGNLVIWDAIRRLPVAQTNLSRAIIDYIVFNPDGSGLYVTSRSTNVVLLDRRTLQVRSLFTGHNSKVCGLALDSSGSLLLTCAGEYHSQDVPGEMFLWDVRNARIEFRFPKAERAYLHPRFSSSGRFTCRSVDRTGRIEVWDVLARQKVGEGVVPGGFGSVIDFSPDEQVLAVGGQDGFVQLIEWRHWKNVGSLGPHPGGVRSLQFAADGTRLISGSVDSVVRLWDVPERKLFSSLRGHRGDLNVSIFSPDGRYVLSRGGADQTVRLWSAERRNTETLLDLQKESLGWGRFVGDSPILCLLRTTELGTALKVWNMASNAVDSAPSLRRTASSDEPVYFTATPGGIAMCVAGSDLISLQHASTGDETARLVSPYPLLGSMAASRDGRWLASVASDNKVVIWDLTSGKGVSVFAMPEGLQFSSVAGSASIEFSADGRKLWVTHPNWSQILVCHWQGTARFEILSGHERGVTSLALSSDGKVLASGSTDMTVGIWNSDTGASMGFLGGENGGVLSVAFSADDKTLAMGCMNGQVRLWNVASRSEMVRLHSHGSSVYSVAFSRDGHSLVSVSYDGTTRFWHAPAP